MATERLPQQLLLAALVVVLIGAIYRLLPATSATPGASSNRRAGSTAPAARGQSSGSGAPDVHLEALDAERPKPDTERNLFRFRS
jgi:hypothetical protein